MSALGEVTTERAAAGALVASVSGEVDVTNADELAGQIAQAATNDVDRLVVDFSDCSFLDSSGIRALIELSRRVQSRGGMAVIVVPERSPLRRIFEITRIEEIIPLVPTREEALGTP